MHGFLSPPLLDTPIDAICSQFCAITPYRNRKQSAVLTRRPAGQSKRATIFVCLSFFAIGYFYNANALWHVFVEDGFVVVNIIEKKRLFRTNDDEIELCVGRSKNIKRENRLVDVKNCLYKIRDLSLLQTF